MRQCYECGQPLADDEGVEWYGHIFCSLECLKAYRGDKEEDDEI